MPVLDPIRGDPIPSRIEDRRIEDAGKSFWGIFNLQSSILDGIGSNTGVLDPIPSRIEDQRLKMQEKVSGASSIFNLRSRHEAAAHMHD